jgi:ankyrin repeat protein
MPDLDDLMAAVVSGNLPEVWSLLDAPGAAPAIFEGREAMALSMACMHAGPYNIEREGIVNALLRAGATPDLASLLHSINAGNVSVLKLLLDAGADAQAIGRHGWTALHSACRSSAVCVELSGQLTSKRRRASGKVLLYPDKCETYDGSRERPYTERARFSAAYEFVYC